MLHHISCSPKHWNEKLVYLRVGIHGSRPLYCNRAATFVHYPVRDIPEHKARDKASDFLAVTAIHAAKRRTGSLLL